MTTSGPTASQRVFDADLDRFSAMFEKADAIVTFNDGWQGIDSTKVPADAMRSYNRLLQYGFANGLI